MLNLIDWSRRLDETFKENYEKDPGLYGQFFASSYGFLRHYPAAKWSMNDQDPDVYDARLRDWYIKAASSPKAR